MAQVAYTLAERVLTPPRQEVKVLDVKEARPLPRRCAHCTCVSQACSQPARQLAPACYALSFAVVLLSVRAERPPGEHAVSAGATNRDL